ncbi:DUF2975 domain-containing protein [Echinicola sp. 20G]|uniref:DUF2975 domain-containing protein n=1 Tax=Echinicola sp. 20G TaxID=2781961 RepID=UPI001910248C|nr:DUF2975 domain-containing protein [Echinicola sp. 20G]
MNQQDRNHGVQSIDILIFIFQAMKILIWISLIMSSILIIVTLIPNEGAWKNIIPPPNFVVYFSLPEELGIAQWGDGNTTPFSIVSALGVIKTTFAPKSLVLFYSLMTILTTLLILFSIIFTVRILKSVKKKAFLLVENAVRLRWIALLGIGIYFTDRITSTVTSSQLSKHLQFPEVDFTGINFFAFLNFESIFGSLFLLVIAEVFRMGAQLKEENDLTI